MTKRAITEFDALYSSGILTSNVCWLAKRNVDSFPSEIDLAFYISGEDGNLNGTFNYTHMISVIVGQRIGSIYYNSSTEEYNIHLSLYRSTDPTLTRSNSAADAKAVGDALKGVLAPKNFLDLVDKKTGYVYRIEMNDGKLTSRLILTNIAITTMPNKIVYTDGERFDPTGMVITGVGQDGSECIVDNYTITPEFASSNSPYITIVTDDASIDVPIIVNSFDPTAELTDFIYTTNSDGTYTIIGWKQMLNGESSTELVVPNNHNIIV